MKKKIDTLREYMAAGQWEEAIKFAAKFPRLGEHAKAIQQAAGAINNPGFYKQLGKNIDELKKAGQDALLDKYGEA